MPLYLFDGEPLHTYIVRSLYEATGLPWVMSSNFKYLIVEIFTAVLKKTEYLLRSNASRWLAHLELDESTLRTLLEEWTDEARGLITSTLINGLTDHNFEVWWSDNRTLAVRDHGPMPMMRPPSMQDFRQGVEMDIERGDFVPERIRRLAGLF